MEFVGNELVWFRAVSAVKRIRSIAPSVCAQRKIAFGARLASRRKMRDKLDHESCPLATALGKRQQTHAADLGIPRSAMRALNVLVQCNRLISSLRCARETIPHVQCIGICTGWEVKQIVPQQPNRFADARQDACGMEHERFLSRSFQFRPPDSVSTTEGEYTTSTNRGWWELHCRQDHAQWMQGLQREKVIVSMPLQLCCPLLGEMWLVITA